MFKKELEKLELDVPGFEGVLIHRGNVTMKDLLLNRGWKLTHNSAGEETLVWFSNPRIGWKTDGTLIVGYHEWPEKVFTIKRLNEILNTI